MIPCARQDFFFFHQKKQALQHLHQFLHVIIDLKNCKQMQNTMYKIPDGKKLLSLLRLVRCRVAMLVRPNQTLIPNLEHKNHDYQAISKPYGLPHGYIFINVLNGGYYYEYYHNLSTGLHQLKPSILRLNKHIHTESSYLQYITSTLLHSVHNFTSHNNRLHTNPKGNLQTW